MHVDGGAMVDLFDVEVGVHFEVDCSVVGD
jgi:hypothetical protein